MTATQQTMAPMLLTRDDIQQVLRIGRDHARRLMNDGTLPVVMLGPRKPRVSRAALEKWIAEQTPRAS